VGETHIFVRPPILLAPGPGETAHSEASRFSWHEPEGVQKGIRIFDENTIVCQVIDQSSKQSCQEEGIAREAESIHRGTAAGESRSIHESGN
jgi:hypothetical protein